MLQIKLTDKIKILTLQVVALYMHLNSHPFAIIPAYNINKYSRVDCLHAIRLLISLSHAKCLIIIKFCKPADWCSCIALPNLLSISSRDSQKKKKNTSNIFIMHNGNAKAVDTPKMKEISKVAFKSYVITHAIMNIVILVKTTLFSVQRSLIFTFNFYRYTLSKKRISAPLK